MSQSFAKFREKFARGAAGAEIFRNLPLTAPLASQAHAVHMYRIIIERFLYGPRSLGGHLRQHLTSNCLAIFATSAQPPTAPPRRVPRAALAHRGPPSSPLPSPAAPTLAVDTLAVVFSHILKFTFGDQQWATCNSGPRLGITSRRHSCSRGRTTSVRGLAEPEPQFNAGASVHVTRAYSECSMTPPLTEQGSNGLVKY